MATTAAPKSFVKKKSAISTIREKGQGIGGIANELKNPNKLLGLKAGDDRAVGEDYQKDTCIICFEAKTNALYKPCDHGGMCRDCSIQNFNSRKKCALCRKDVQLIVIYEEAEDGKLYQVEQYPEAVGIK